MMTCVLGHADEVNNCCALVWLEVEGERREKLASLLDFQVGDCETFRKLVLGSHDLFAVESEHGE